MDFAWNGIVTEVWDDGDTFTVDLRREGLPDLLAEFSMRECGVDVVPGDLLVIQRDSVAKPPRRVWTQEEIDDIRHRAAIRSAKLRSMFN